MFNQGDEMSQRKVTITNNEEAAQEMGADQTVDIKVENTEEQKQEVPEEEPNVQIEDLPDEEKLWEDGPSAGLVKQWKNEYGEIYVTSITFDKHIIWRVLNRLEYKNLVKKMEQLVQAGQLSNAEANMWNEESIAELCILYPTLDKADMTGVMAGIPSLIAQEVLEASGFVALEVRQL
jgi:hypothetical protein